MLNIVGPVDVFHVIEVVNPRTTETKPIAIAKIAI